VTASESADDDSQRLLDLIREANRGGDVHLVGGPTTIEIYPALVGLDTLELVGGRSC
jgi:hypothetical protein